MCHRGWRKYEGCNEGAACGKRKSKRRRRRKRRQRRKEGGDNGDLGSDTESSGYPFSLTREMSIRFFGYFASENERATGVRAISLPGFLFLYPRIVRQTNVPNISVGPFLPLLPLLLPPLIGRSPLRSPMHLLTLAPGPLARISHITFRILPFSAASPFSSGRFLDLAVA